MIAAKPIDVRARLKEYMDRAFNGEPVIVSRKGNRNVVIISEQEFNELQKAKRNAEYLMKLERSFGQLERGEIVLKSMEELEHMADECTVERYKSERYGGGNRKTGKIEVSSRLFQEN